MNTDRNLIVLCHLHDRINTYIVRHKGMPERIQLYCLKAFLQILHQQLCAVFLERVNIHSTSKTIRPFADCPVYGLIILGTDNRFLNLIHIHQLEKLLWSRRYICPAADFTDMRMCIYFFHIRFSSKNESISVRDSIADSTVKRTSPMTVCIQILATEAIAGTTPVRGILTSV